MFGLGFGEIALILVVALIVLGPSKLPELAKGLGKGLREFRKATEDFKSTIDEELYRPDPPRHPPVATAAQHPTALPATAAAAGHELLPAAPVPTADPTRVAPPQVAPSVAVVAASAPAAEPVTSTEPKAESDKLPH